MVKLNRPCVRLNSEVIIGRRGILQIFYSSSASFSAEKTKCGIGRSSYLECTGKNLEWSAQNWGRNRTRNQTQTGLFNHPFLYAMPFISKMDFTGKIVGCEDYSRFDFPRLMRFISDYCYIWNRLVTGDRHWTHLHADPSPSLPAFRPTDNAKDIKTRGAHSYDNGCMREVK